MGFFAWFEPIRLVAGFQDVAVVGQAIQQGRGYFGVHEDLHPFSKVEIRGHDQRGFFVELADEMEQQGAAGLGKPSFRTPLVIA